MENSKAAFFGLTLALSSLVAAPASASNAALLAGANATVAASGPVIIAVAHRECPPFCSESTKKHRKFDERRHSNQLHIDDDDGDGQFHKKHRKHRRHRRGPDIDFGLDGGYYGPFYDWPYYHRPYYYDPYYYPRYYDLPVYSKRLSCDKARKRVRQNGYHNVKALDCSGKTYVFSAVKGNKRYKIKVSARNGGIISRKRY